MIENNKIPFTGISYNETQEIILKIIYYVNPLICFIDEFIDRVSIKVTEQYEYLTEEQYIEIINFVKENFTNQLKNYCYEVYPKPPIENKNGI